MDTHSQLDVCDRLIILARRARVTRGEVAAQMGITAWTMSMVTNGRLPMPADFEERFRAALNELVAERAALVAA